MATRILIADDDASLVRVLRLALARDGYEIVTAGDGETALKLFQTESPDLIVLDAALPRLDGFTVTERIRANSPDIPIMMLTARDVVLDRLASLVHGADDYLVKPFAVDELEVRIPALLRRHQATTTSRVLAFSDLSVDLDTHEVFRDDQELQLTPHQFRLLAVFLQNPRKVLSRDQLCRQAWGYPYHGESNFIDVTVKELRRRTEVGGRPRLIQTVRGFGYALRAH
ncbi:MAG: response regulator transcription factor [Chloroflexi bacterium]|nr:response regulator transcription factor [Chloroflexota bacterium]